MKNIVLMISPLALPLFNRLANGFRMNSGSLIGDFVSLFVSGCVLTILFFITGRQIATVLLGIFLSVLLFAGNSLKVAILKEPLVFSDVFLAGHAIKYPRLYFGYAPNWVYVVIFVVILFLALVISAEEPVAINPSFHHFNFGMMVVMGTGLLLVLSNRKLTARVLKKTPLSFDPIEDAQNYSPIGAVFLHSLWHVNNRRLLRKKFAFSEKAAETENNIKNKCPHILLIQAESFCRMKTAEGLSMTPQIDALFDESESGQLLLKWSGAYTMRTEFSVLCGLGIQSLQTYGFDPYRLASLEPMDSLARKLKKLGYKTIVWHPNSRYFFSRDKVMPNLGFDEFIADEQFASIPTHGRYTSDQILLERAIDFLESSKEPTFLFVVTMEAHGPWDGEQFGVKSMSPEACYAEHLKNLDRGIGKVREAVQERNLDIVLGVYGDHLPSLHESRLPERPEWCVWRKGCQKKRLNIKPEDLQHHLIQEVL